MFIFNGVFTCEVRGGGGMRLMSPPKSAIDATCTPRPPIGLVENFCMGFFVRVFEWTKNSSLPHQIFSWKFYFYETKVIVGRPVLTILFMRGYRVFFGVIGNPPTAVCNFFLLVDLPRALQQFGSAPEIPVRTPPPLLNVRNPPF